MLLTSIYLSDGAVQAVRGRRRQKRLEIYGCASCPLPKDSLVHGEIRNPWPVRQALKSCVEQLGSPVRGAGLLVDNALVRVKTLKLPAMRASQTERFLQMEMAAPYRNPGEYLYDYSVLNRSRKEMQVLGGALRRDHLEAYLRLFEGCGIRLNSLAPALTGMLRLVAFLPEWREKNFLLVCGEDGEHVLLSVFLRGNYLTSSRIFCPGGVGTQEGCRRLVGQITAFYYMQEARGEETFLEGAALCGRLAQGEFLYRELSGALDRKVFCLKDSAAVEAGHAKDSPFRLSEYFIVTGNLLRR